MIIFNNETEFDSFKKMVLTGIDNKTSLEKENRHELEPVKIAFKTSFVCKANSFPIETDRVVKMRKNLMMSLRQPSFLSVDASPDDIFESIIAGLLNCNIVLLLDDILAKYDPELVVDVDHRRRLCLSNSN